MYDTYDEIVPLFLEPLIEAELYVHTSAMYLASHTANTYLVLDRTEQTGLLLRRLATAVENAQNLGRPSESPLRHIPRELLNASSGTYLHGIGRVRVSRRGMEVEATGWEP